MTLRVAAALLARAHGSFDHRIHDLEMRGIERERHVHVAAGRAQIRREALVVLHVARALHVRGVVLAFEFVEQHRRRLAEHVHENVEAAAMRHADDAFLDALLSALLDQIVEQRNQRVAAFERESLLADVLRVQVTLETFRGGQLPQQVLLFVGRKPAGHASDQELVLQPQPFFGVRDVRELRADRAAIHMFELRDDFAELHLGRDLGGARAGQEHGVEIGFREPEISELEHARTRTLRESQRIEVCDEMSAVCVDLHEARDGALLRGGIVRRRSAGGDGESRPGGALRDAGLNGRMDLLGRAAVTQLLEVLAPARFDALGILEKLLVKSFNVGSISTR
jgi:hypothetical protein